MLLSVIIPVYNAERYLERSVRSITCQGLSEGEYEIILINDGSTDKSWEICLKMAQIFPNTIRVFSKANEGLGPTRQYGIERAKGHYITFCDADDYLLENGYKYVLQEFLTEDIDILSFYSKTVLEDNYCYEVQEKNIYGKTVYDGFGREFYHSRCHTFVWNQIFRKSYLEEKSILFRYLPMVEDVMFNLELAMTNPRMRVVSANIYRYEYHSTSLIHNRNKKFLREAISAYLQLIIRINFYKKQYEYNDKLLSQGLDLYLRNQMLPFISRVFSSDYTNKDFVALKNCLIKEHILPLAVLSKRDRLISFIFKTSYCYFFYQWIYKNIFMKFIFPYLNRTK